MGQCLYKSPTDMGVNMVGRCIVDDEAVQAAARQEIIRRYYTALCDRRTGQAEDELVYKLELIMQQAKVDPSIRPVIAASEGVAEETGNPAAAIQLPDGRVVTGKTTGLLGAASATLLNALKELAGIGHEAHLISPQAIEPIQTVKVRHLGSANPRLHSDETLIALAISASADPLAARALEQLSALRGCEAHSTVILSPVDTGTCARLGLRLTCTPQAIEPIQTVKVRHLGSANPRLHSDETLIALAISASADPLAARALEQLSALRGCEAHSTVILSPVDTGTCARLGLRLTCTPQYETNKLYHK